MKKKLNCILFIEDNELTNIFNQKLLKNLDIAENICFEESAEKGLKFLRYRKENAEAFRFPELIFLDINMPGMNGWEFLDEYKKLLAGQQESSKIIMVTTSPNPDDEQRAESIPEIVAFKRKPLTKTALEEIFSEHFSDYSK